MYVRDPLSLSNVEELLSERRIDICHETVRLRWNQFGPMFAAVGCTFRQWLHLGWNKSQLSQFETVTVGAITGRHQEIEMAGMTLQDVSKMMKDIDFVMLNTHTENGKIAGRPMSNNRDVEFDGDSWFFVDHHSRIISDLKRDPNVSLSIQGAKGLFGKPPVFISIEGQADITQDKIILAEHWTPQLKRWWPDGPDAPGLALIKIHAGRIHYWDGEDEGEVSTV